MHAIKGASLTGVGGGSAAAAAGGGVGAEVTGGDVNWASPAATFPVVVGLLAVPEYHNAIGERLKS